MTAEQKLQNVEAQITAAEQGRTNVLNCPYCGKHNVQGEPLCCTSFGRAVAAVLLRKERDDQVEHAERILEKVERN